MVTRRVYRNEPSRRKAVILEEMDRPNTPQASIDPAPSPTLEQLAAQQGVRPVKDFESLLGHPSKEDESEEEFAAMLRRWRSESPQKPPD